MYICYYGKMFIFFITFRLQGRAGSGRFYVYFFFERQLVIVHVFLILALTCGIKCLRAYAAYNVRM
jgi:hypothetical protein